MKTANVVHLKPRTCPAPKKSSGERFYHGDLTDDATGRYCAKCDCFYPADYDDLHFRDPSAA